MKTWGSKSLAWKADFEKAFLDFNEAIRLDPGNAVAFNDRGQVRYRTGDFAGALADYDQAIKIDPEYNAAYTERGKLFEFKGNLPAARASYATAASLTPKYATGQRAVATASEPLAALKLLPETLPGAIFGGIPFKPTAAPPTSTPVVVP